MIIGYDIARLEQRIAKALYSGSLRPRESGFLQNVSRNIVIYGERAFISDAQASWLFTILTNFEKGPKTSPSAQKLRRPARTIPVRSSHDDAAESLQRDRVLAGLDGHTWTDEEPPQPIDFSKAFSSS